MFTMAPAEELALLDIDRSNKGASKQRRDQINAEINVMRDLLPLPPSSRQRLSQLQIMSLSCVYIRKCNVLQKLFPCKSQEQNIPDSLDFFQALTGFLLVTTRDGKLLYISENVTDFLGHSMVDMKTQGDSLYDIVDKRDHSTVQAQLLQGSSVESKDTNDVSFFCRMNMSRTLKRQSGFGDVKVMHVQGHFVHCNSTEGTNPNDSQQVFMASCSPLITPDLKENLVQNNTMVFKTVHRLDMTFVEVTKMAEYHLGFTTQEMNKKSWYSMLHPEDIHEAKEKHTQLIRSNHEMGSMMTVRLLTADSSIVWLNIVMHVRQSSLTHSEEPYIICINQVISAQEAYQIKMQGQMFSVYPGRVQELWGNHVSNATPSPSTGTPWIQPNRSTPSVVSGYQNGMQMFVNQSEFPLAYHQMCSPSQMPCQSGMTQSKMNSTVHTDKLKAMLKRKIQGPGMSCRPMKISKMLHDYNGIQDGHEFSEQGPMIHHNNHHIHTGNRSNVHCQNDSVQVLQASNYRFGLLQAKKAHKMKSTGNFMHLPHHDVHSCTSQMSQEQVVPDMNVPESYLTPDPSPISSPQPSHAIVKMETLDPEEMAASGKSSVSILQALEKLASLPQGNAHPNLSLSSDVQRPPQQVSPCSSRSSNKIELPIFDAFEIDNFFDTLEIPEQDVSKVSVIMEDRKLNHEIKTGIPGSSYSVMKNLPCLSEIKKEVPCFSPTLTFQGCNSPSSITESLPDQDYAFTQVKMEEVDLSERRKSSISSTNSDMSGLNNKDLVVSSMMIKSPESVVSQETSAGTDSFDGLLSCFSDDGLDLSPLQTDPRTTILDSSLSESMLMDRFNITEEKFFSANKPQSNVVGLGSYIAPEMLSPHSSTSSLAGEDEILDNQSTWSLDMMLDTIQPQNPEEIGSQCNLKDQEVLGMESGFSQLDMFFNSLARFEGSLDLPKHGQ